MAHIKLLLGAVLLFISQVDGRYRSASRSARLTRYSRYRYSYSSYRSSSYYYSTYRSYRSAYSRSAYYGSSSYTSHTYSYARTYVQPTIPVRFTRQGYSTYNYYYYNMYYTAAAALMLANRHYREGESLSVCENYEALQNTSSSTVPVLGRFTCPLEFEPDNYNYCCGRDMQQYCCPFFANQGNLAGVVIGSILGFVVFGAVIGAFITCCVHKYRRSQLAKRRWRKAGLVARLSTKTNRVQPGGVRYIPSQYAPPPSYQPGHQAPPYASNYQSWGGPGASAY